MVRGLPSCMLETCSEFYKLRVHNGIYSYVYNYYTNYELAEQTAKSLKDIGICTSYSIEHASKEEIPVTDRDYD